MSAIDNTSVKTFLFGIALTASGFCAAESNPSDANPPEPYLGISHSEKLWNEKVRPFGDSHGLRFGSALTIIENKVDGTGAHGRGFDWDIYVDYIAYQHDDLKLTVGAQTERRDTWMGSDPNFNGFPAMSTFVLDGNFYDHSTDLVEAWLNLEYKSLSVLAGRFDQGRRFAGFSYGGSFRYFFNQAFSGNSTLSLPFAQAAGIDITWKPNNQYYAMFGIADANAVSNRFDNSNGDLFSYAEFTLTPKAGFYHFYVWHSEGGYRDQKKGQTPQYTNESYGGGVSLEQQLNRQLTVFSRLGLANKDGTAPSSAQASLGFVQDQRGRLSYGAGISWNRATDAKQFGLIDVVHQNQLTAEVFARTELTEKINLSLGYTAINKPFYSTDNNEHVYSARLQVWY